MQADNLLSRCAATYGCAGIYDHAAHAPDLHPLPRQLVSDQSLKFHCEVPKYFLLLIPRLQLEPLRQEGQEGQEGQQGRGRRRRRRQAQLLVQSSRLQARHVRLRRVRLLRRLLVSRPKPPRSSWPSTACRPAPRAGAACSRLPRSRRAPRPRPRRRRSRRRPSEGAASYASRAGVDWINFGLSGLRASDVILAIVFSDRLVTQSPRRAPGLTGSTCDCCCFCGRCSRRRASG